MLRFAFLYLLSNSYLGNTVLLSLHDCNFAGLPEVWAQQEGDTTFAQAAFDQQGRFPPVVDNVHLVKGLFSDSLPPFLQLQVCCCLCY